MKIYQSKTDKADRQVMRTPDGTPLRGNGRGSMLAIFGPHHQHCPSFSFIHRDALHV